MLTDEAGQSNTCSSRGFVPGPSSHCWAVVTLCVGTGLYCTLKGERSTVYNKIGVYL